jgi:hypothetical protein
MIQSLGYLRNKAAQLGKTPRKKRISHNLLLRLLNYQDEVLRFLTNSGVPFTSNQAE